MLVRSIKPFKDYTGTHEIGVGKFFIVYAIDSSPIGKEYFVLPIGSANGEPDPLFFPAENFEIVIDLVTNTWVSKKVSLPRGMVNYVSFPEWFENDFYIRARDWDLEGNDYTIIQKYKQKYEQLYKDYIPRKS